MANKGKRIRGNKIVPPGYSPVSGCTPPQSTRFKPGQSGNPTGTRTAGASVKEWLNVMAKWGETRTKFALTDPKATNAKKLAALIWVEAMTGGGANFDRIMDRTEPKPVQTVDVTSNGQTVGQAAELDAIQVILNDPKAVNLANDLARRMALNADGDGSSSN